MNGREVFRYAVEIFNISLQVLLKYNNMSIGDVDLLVTHQANARIIEKVIEASGIDRKNVLITIDRHANTSAASIPLSLYGIRDVFFSKKNVVMLGMGAGFTWGSALIRM
jgi:3-oxoacyl-[acyl-carrier-protein] synthase-3